MECNFVLNSLLKSNFGDYYELYFFGIPYIISNNNDNLRIKIDNLNEWKIDISNYKKIEKISKEAGIFSFIFELESNLNVIKIKFYNNNKYFYTNINIIQFESLDIQSIIQFIDKIHSTILIKPNDNILFNTICQLNKIFNHKILNEDSKMELLFQIKSSTSFTQFWIASKQYLKRDNV
jgi:hypothetical protein